MFRPVDESPRALPSPPDSPYLSHTEPRFRARIPGLVRLVPVDNPPNPWASTHVEYLDEIPTTRLVVYEDASRTIVAENDSPDVGFRYSVNPYRGCAHACTYCYARPTHEYLDLGAGTDFDTHVVVKPRAPELLSQRLAQRSWSGELLAFSGVTDCYQPLEASLGLTRACLEVCADRGNPVAIITKGALIERDLDVLSRLTREADVQVIISIGIFDAGAARALEPYAPSPARRLRTVAALAGAGVKVGVLVAPFIPGISEDGLSQVLSGAAAAGATSAGYVLLRLPAAVGPVFEARLQKALPDRAARVLGLVRGTRGGALYDARYGVRGRGEGAYAAMVEELFRASARKARLSLTPALHRQGTFRRLNEQLSLL